MARRFINIKGQRQMCYDRINFAEQVINEDTRSIDIDYESDLVKAFKYPYNIIKLEKERYDV
tara:strand:- start:246 stop:431 length:186 start_codon:yes stop_codon:yes gene_type:complete